MLNVEFGIDVLEHSVIELLAIVDDDDMEKSKSANDRFLGEIIDLALGNVCQRFYLYPFCKVVHSDD